MTESAPAVRQAYPVDLRLTAAARRELERRGQPLIVHLELLFSCMIRKQVLFPPARHPDALSLDCGGAGIQVGFRAVGTKTCLISDQAVPDLQTFPIKRVKPFIPKWLSLDFKGGHWQGDFGYAETKPS